MLPIECAKRRTDTLNPAIDRTSWTPEADDQLVNQYGKVWNRIVDMYFPGRTGLSAKNRITRFGAQNSRTRTRRRPQDTTTYHPVNLVSSTSESESSSSSFVSPLQFPTLDATSTSFDFDSQTVESTSQPQSNLLHQPHVYGSPEHSRGYPYAYSHITQNSDPRTPPTSTSTSSFNPPSSYPYNGSAHSYEYGWHWPSFAWYWPSLVWYWPSFVWYWPPSTWYWPSSVWHWPYFL